MLSPHLLHIWTWINRQFWLRTQITVCMISSWQWCLPIFYEMLYQNLRINLQNVYIHILKRCSGTNDHRSRDHTDATANLKSCREYRLTYPWPSPYHIWKFSVSEEWVLGKRSHLLEIQSILPHWQWLLIRHDICILVMIIVQSSWGRI